MVAWKLAAAHQAPASPPASWEPLCSGNRDQDRNHVSSLSWTTRFPQAEVKVFVLLSLELGADL